jgi:hypothetical protein
MEMTAETSPAPAPHVMPVDREKWSRELNLTNFTNSYYQYRDLQALPGIRKVLIVGPGQGLDTQVLRWRGYDIVTYDIDATFAPDLIGSVHDLGAFEDGAFDAVIASHVIEHLPIAYLEPSLAELARVARYALVYLPVAGRSAQLRIRPGVFGLDLSFVLDMRNWFRKPDPNVALFCGGQHYWEIGRRGFSRRSVARRLSRHFEVVSAYRNHDWLPSMNFVLRSLRNSA